MLSAIDELGYTTRALFLLNEKHNELGQKVEDREMSLRDFHTWRDGTFEPVRTAMVARNIAAKAAVRLGAYPLDGAISDYDGKELTRPIGITLASKQDEYAYSLRLMKDHGSEESNPVSRELSRTFTESENDSTFDREITGSDEYKRL